MKALKRELKEWNRKVCLEEECLEAVRQEVGMEVVGKGGDVVLGGSADAVKRKLREAMSRTAGFRCRTEQGLELYGYGSGVEVGGFIMQDGEQDRVEAWESARIRRECRGLGCCGPATAQVFLVGASAGESDVLSLGQGGGGGDSKAGWCDGVWGVGSR